MRYRQGYMLELKQIQKVNVYHLLHPWGYLLEHVIECLKVLNRLKVIIQRPETNGKKCASGWSTLSEAIWNFSSKMQRKRHFKYWKSKGNSLEMGPKKTYQKPKLLQNHEITMEKQLNQLKISLSLVKQTKLNEKNYSL